MIGAPNMQILALQHVAFSRTGNKKGAQTRMRRKIGAKFRSFPSSKNYGSDGRNV